MPQRPKEHVRQAIVSAALGELASAGYDGVTLAGIARRAGTSVGNVYKYFSSKDELFRAAVPPEFVARVRALLRRRVRALGRAREAPTHPAHPHQQAWEALLQLAAEHRAELLFLLRHGATSMHASFTEDLAGLLTGLAVGYARSAWPGTPMTPALRRSVRRSYRALLFSMAAVLEEEPAERALREALTRLMTYHLAGLRAVLAAAGGRRRR